MADVGRPTKFKPEYVEQTYKLCLLGATDTELADFFNVEESTINNWKLANPEFLESIKRGKTLADANVAESLYKRANGYEHPEVDIKMYEGSIIKTDLIKHYPPDTAACFIWLKNRRSSEWRDKHEIDHTTKGEAITGIDYSKLSDAAIREIIAAGRSSEGS